MGNICGIDIFEQLFAKYGDDLVKFIVGEKTKWFLGDKTEEAKKAITEQIFNKKTEAFKQIDGEDERVQKMINDKKGEIGGNIPSGIGNIDDLFGGDMFKKQF